MTVEGWLLLAASLAVILSPVAVLVWLWRRGTIARIRRLVGRAYCLAGRHHPIRVFTDVHLDGASLMGVQGQALASELRCRRCPVVLGGDGT